MEALYLNRSVGGGNSCKICFVRPLWHDSCRTSTAGASASPFRPALAMNINRLVRYGGAVAACLVAMLLRWALRPYLGDHGPFLMLTFAVLAVCWLCGYAPGLLSIALAALIADYYIVPPANSLLVPDVYWGTYLFLFVLLGLAMNGLIEMRRRGEQREAALSDRFHRILEQAPSGLIILSPEGYITFANRCAADIYGTSPGLMVGRLYSEQTWGNRQRDGLPPQAGLPFREALASPDAAVQVHLKAMGRTGEDFELTATATCLSDKTRHCGDVLVCVSDGRGPASGDAPSVPDPVSVPAPAPVPILYLDHTAKWSGGEIALARLLGSLDRTRFRPLVLLAEDGPLVERLREMNVETHVLPLSGAIRNVRKDTLGLGAALRGVAVVPFLAYVVRVARFARRHRVAVIHTNSLKSDLYGALAGRLARIPVVWHVRDHIDPSYLPTPAVHLFRRLARVLPSYVVTNSESTRERLFLSDTRPSAIVPSGLDLRQSVIPDGLGRQEMLNTGTQGPHTWEGPVRIGIVGRLAEWKGQHVFLEAAERLRADGLDIRCLIIGSAMFGEGDYEARLRRMAEAELLRPVTEFLGFRKDVASLLGEIDILVHASTSPEPFGQVVIEGMAEGLPVIGTDGGGVREIITDGQNGLLVPMGDAAALARALERLIRDPAEARRLGQAGYWHVRKHFTAAQSARRVEKVYGDVLAAHP